MSYKLAKQLYRQGAYQEVIRLAADRSSVFKRIPFRDGQSLKVETSGDNVIGQYLGTIQDGLLLSVGGHSTLVPYTEIQTICVYWH